MIVNLLIVYRVVTMTCCSELGFGWNRRDRDVKSRSMYNEAYQCTLVPVDLYADKELS
jgi:hypothetical protein